jgi:hypothetical protein
MFQDYLLCDALFSGNHVYDLKVEVHCFRNFAAIMMMVFCSLHHQGDDGSKEDDVLNPAYADMRCYQFWSL